MEKLQVNNFKAFCEETVFEFAKKSCLFFGENGSGKSSIYEAIKLLFFKDKIENVKIRPTLTPEEKDQCRQDLYSSYNNKKNNTSFQLNINSEDYSVFNNIEYQVFMISSENINYKSNIFLTDLIKSVYFTIEVEVENFLDEHSELIELEVNSVLKNFKENIQIKIDSSDNYKCIITDQERKLVRGDELYIYFNEAKLDLVILLFLFVIAQLLNDTTKKNKILVLDDFITSLDTANRTFLIDYILKTFVGYQKIIFTHNISFYNLITYIINNKYKQSDDWTFFNLYEIDKSHRIYFHSIVEDTDKIREDYQIENSDIIHIGNRIRKRFEILLYEFSKLLMLGAVEDTKKILSLLTQDRPLYFHEHKTSIDLIDDIQVTLNSDNHYRLANRIQRKIDTYKKENFNNLKVILKNLILYQKVTMHPLSHGTIGLANFTTKEIEESLDLLKKLETILNSYENNDVVSV